VILRSLIYLKISSRVCPKLHYAVQWDDYLGYHAELPSKIDRTAKLTKFVQQMITAMKKLTLQLVLIFVIITLLAKQYFAVDWKNGMSIECLFKHNEANFKEELCQNYAELIRATSSSLKRISR